MYVCTTSKAAKSYPYLPACLPTYLAIRCVYIYIYKHTLSLSLAHTLSLSLSLYLYVYLPTCLSVDLCMYLWMIYLDI